PAGVRVHRRRLARTRVAHGRGAAYVSVANGRRTSRDGVLTEGVHLSGYPAKVVARCAAAEAGSALARAAVRPRRGTVRVGLDRVVAYRRDIRVHRAFR